VSDFSELRKEVGEIRELAARTDSNTRWLREAFGYQVTRGDKHEERLGKVENRQWWIAGIFTAIGALLGVGGANQLKP
jgi:hypothetical protein